MDTEKTLYGALKGYECHFTHVVHEAVKSALTDLGDEIRKLDWANLSVSTADKDAAKAA